MIGRVLDKLVPKPENLTFEQAAVVPISGLTAMQAARDAAKVRAGRYLEEGHAAGKVAIRVSRLA